MAAASKIWVENHFFKTETAAAVISLESYPVIRNITGPSGTLSTWGLPDTVTVDAVLYELAARNKTNIKEADAASNKTTHESEYQHQPRFADTSSAHHFAEAEHNFSLSGVPTWALIFWLYVIAPMVFVLVNWESARLGLADLNARLPQTESLAEMRKFIRTELSGRPGDIRLVKGKNVRLRKGPGMKEKVILLLPPDAVVVVLGKDNRTWLYVSYEHQGHMIDGYISTKLLKRVIN